MRSLISLCAGMMLASVSTGVLADDWTADRLRGTVMLMQSGDWVALARGQVVPDGGRVRTESDGRVELIRGAERISLSSNTEIAIRDSGSQRMTNVIQSRGTVTVDAERRNVQHFSVQTPVLAAVVKGTQFTVTYINGQASVSVDRGVVQVQDAGHEMMVDVTPGQVAEARQTQPLDVSGPGSEKVVFLIQGEVVPAVAREAVLSGNISAAEAVEVVRENPALLTATPSRSVAGNGGGADEANRNSGPGNNSGPDNGPGNGKGPGRGDGPGKGNGPGNAGGPGNGNGPGNGGGPGHGNNDGPGNGRGSDNGRGPSNNDGPGNGRGSDNGNGPGSSNGNGPGNSDGPGNGGGPGGDKGPGNGGGPGSGDRNGNGPGNGGGPGNDNPGGPGNGDGPGNGGGPGADKGPGNGRGSDNSNGPGDSNGPGNGGGPGGDRGPGNGGGPGNDGGPGNGAPGGGGGPASDPGPGGGGPGHGNGHGPGEHGPG